MLRDLISSHKLDFIFLTETWLKPGGLPSGGALPTQLQLSECSYRLPGCGGAMAAVFKNHLTCIPFSSGSFVSFEILAFKIVCDNPICCVIIYQPPQLKYFPS